MKFKSEYKGLIEQNYYIKINNMANFMEILYEKYSKLFDNKLNQNCFVFGYMTKYSGTSWAEKIDNFRGTSWTSL